MTPSCSAANFSLSGPSSRSGSGFAQGRVERVRRALTNDRDDYGGERRPASRDSACPIFSLSRFYPGPVEGAELGHSAYGWIRLAPAERTRACWQYRPKKG